MVEVPTDAGVQQTERAYNAAREAIHEEVGRHDFVESEFPEGAGYCDVCGGAPGAKIHLPVVDHMARLADAAEEIAAGIRELREFVHEIRATMKEGGA